MFLLRSHPIISMGCTLKDKIFRKNLHRDNKILETAKCMGKNAKNKKIKKIKIH